MCATSHVSTVWEVSHVSVRRTMSYILVMQAIFACLRCFARLILHGPPEAAGGPRGPLLKNIV